MEGGAISPWVQLAATTIDGVDGFEVPSWSAITAGQRAPIMDGGQGTWCPTAGVAACSCNQDRVQLQDRNSDAQMSPMEQALLRSQSGRCAGVTFSAVMADFGQFLTVFGQF